MADSSPDAEDDQDESDERDPKEKLLAVAHARFQSVVEYESEIRQEALDDLKFSTGDQWPTDLKNSRAEDSRPCLVINRLPAAIRQVTNDLRKNRPAINTNPVDDDATVETAEIIDGLIRHIEYSSNADFAYDTAADSQVRSGLGYFRIVTDFADPLSFDQELKFVRIPNWMRVYKDPSSREPDGSDMNWCFITEDLTHEEYKERYPNSKISSAADISGIGDTAQDWLPSGKVRIAEYLYKEFRDETLVLLSDGSIGPLDGLPMKDGKPNLPEGLTVVKTRASKVPQVKWCLINGHEVLEEKSTVFSNWIPVIPVYGEELDIDGKVRISGIVRDAKDPQRMANYWASSETEAIALAPRAPFVIAEGQVEGYEKQWTEANRRNQAYLPYKPQTLNGTIPVPPPQRQTFEPAVQAITMARAQAIEDIKATTGIYDADLGNRSNETSGIAIQRRNSQAQTSNFHFADNLHRSIRHAGRILVDAIPFVYDAARTIRIVGADGEQKQVLINQQHQQGGKTVLYDMSVGRYDVAVSTGPSYETKRQEATASMLELVRGAPQLINLIGDLIVKEMDWHNSKAISERLKLALPPALQDQDPNQQQMPAQAKAQMAQMQQMVKRLSGALHDAHNKIDTKKYEVDSKERTANKKLVIDAEITLAELGQKGALAMLDAQVRELEGRIGMFSQAAQQDAGHAQALEAASHASTLSPPAGSPGAPADDAPTGGQPPGQPMGNES